MRRRADTGGRAVHRRLTLLRALCVVVSALLATAALAQDGQLTWEQLQAVYAYDATAPLDVQQGATERRGTNVSESFSFAGADGERVPAVLYRSEDVEAPPCCVFLHGYGGKKEDALLVAALLLPQGMAVMAIDARLHGERAEEGRELLSPEALADGGRPLVNTVIDNRRALDYLATREDLDAERTVLLGVSMGGILGGVLAVVDERIDAAALLVAGGRWDLVAQDSEHPAARRLRELGLSGELIRQMTATIDPVSFVGHISPRPVLMANGTEDRIIPKACAEALHQAAQEPKQVIWYEGGHVGITPETIETVVRWLAEEAATAPDQQ